MTNQQALRLPASSPRRLLTKRRYPISIRFNRRKGYDTIQVRITIDGNGGSPFSTLTDKAMLYATGVSWSQSQQRAIGRSELDRTFNQEIDRIRTSIDAIYDRQKAAGLAVTPRSIQQEYQTATPFSSLTLALEHKRSAVECYRTYLNELQSGGFPEKNLEKTTLAKWGYGLTYLEAYVEQTKETDSLSIGSADALTLFWGKSYHRWLMKSGPMAADSATRYVNRLIEALNYVAESGAIKQNPLANLKLPRDKTKEVYFLEPEQLERFWQLNLPGKTGVACWWMGVIFLTGLDYCDAVWYVENRSLYERNTPFGKTIVIRRSKPPRAECHIPVASVLEALLAKQPKGPAPKDWEVNREMYAVATLCGFPHRLTCKVGRKTAGAIFYAEYEDIGAVSRMLGHGSVSMTERYYVKTSGHTVAKAMQKRYVKPTTYHPFLRFHKTS